MVSQTPSRDCRRTERTPESAHPLQIALCEDLRMLYPGPPLCHTRILSFEYFLKDVEHDVIGTISNAVDILKNGNVVTNNMWKTEEKTDHLEAILPPLVY